MTILRCNSVARGDVEVIYEKYFEVSKITWARKLEERTTHGGAFFLGSFDVGVEGTSWSRKGIWSKVTIIVTG